ncbi:hypothetical protein QBC32DRAFT_373742 [Pseudoneurospora amorphoporcata]|uniref:MYND-type domain-containing protein n=1 Tax=Pseudoneurospora amorphoporcata TaxID=241081 RepID=A0AAN6SC58_9PEZI|nr:hypothetical protein QBC32DRAFT_373742 [Pseudoneurospora amorphoporcata]
MARPLVTKSQNEPHGSSVFNPLSTTPATNLASPLPPDLDADILFIGGKDVRHILYTAYAEVGGGPYRDSEEHRRDGRNAGHEQRSLKQRKIDITVSNHDKYVVARNVLVLSLILDLKGLEEETEEDGDITKERLARIFDIYHTRFLPDPDTRALLALHASLLCQVSKTLDDWARGPYGKTIHFFNQKSLDAVRHVWEQYASAAAASPESETSEKVAELQAAVAEGMKLSPDEYQSWTLGSSAAPLTTLLKDNIRNYVQWGWNLDQKAGELKKMVANPTFAVGLLSGSDSETGSAPNPQSPSQGRHCRRLAYPSNGVLGYHLALAKAPLTELSPLRPSKEEDDDDTDDDKGIPPIHHVTMHQFTQWSMAFRELAMASTLAGGKQNETRLTIRFAVNGWFTLCQSLLHPPASAPEKAETRKKQFDIVDTTDLSLSMVWCPSSADVPDPPGLLGLMIAAKRLLKDRASSTLVMDDGEGVSLVTSGDDVDGGDDAENNDSLTNSTTASFILGLTPVEYWSNASLRATVDECLGAAAEFYDEDVVDAGRGSKDQEAAAARVKKLEEMGGLQISNRVLRKHSRRLSPDQKHRAVKRPVVVDAKELAEAAWRLYQDLVMSKAEGQRVVQQGQELVKVSWGQGLWQTLLGFLGVVCGQFETNREEFRRVILEKIGGHATQDALLRTALEGVSATEEAEADGCPVFTASFDVTSGTLKTITGHLDFVTEEDKRLLADRTVPISLRQSSPWTIDIVLGSGGGTLVKPLVFPTPVLKEGSKTRIARTSGYIEVMAPAILNPRSAIPSSVLDGYIFPTVLQPASSADSSSSEPTQLMLPVSLNCPTVNLDSLPILSLSDTSRLTFLSTLAASIYSPRELRVRNAAMEQGLPESSWGSARLTLKESFHTMIIIAAGLQVGQTGLFALSGSGSSSSDGRHILILISAIRLDCSAQSGGGLVIDAAVLPLTRDLLAKNNKSETDGHKGEHTEEEEEEEEDLQSFLILLRTLECVDMVITDAELLLWKSLLPAFAERCRTYSHSPSSCEYNYSQNCSIPLSLQKGEPVLCTCGTGHFPPSYLSLPLWDSVASRHATRVAISIPYCSPAAEKVVFDPVLAKKIAERGLEDAVLKKKKEERCRFCGKGEEELVGELRAKGGETAGTAGIGEEKKKTEVLRKCARCLKVRYCCLECQRRDWKTHKTECVESERHQDR